MTNAPETNAPEMTKVTFRAQSWRGGTMDVLIPADIQWATGPHGDPVTTNVGAAVRQDNLHTTVALRAGGRFAALHFERTVPGTIVVSNVSAPGAAFIYACSSGSWSGGENLRGIALIAPGGWISVTSNRHRTWYGVNASGAIISQDTKPGGTFTEL